MGDQSTPTTNERKSGTPCQCFTTHIYDLDAESGYEVPEPVYGECDQITTRTFAPGHDAKLKSLLQRLHVAGGEYHVVSGGMLISGSPMLTAAERGWERFLRSAERIANDKDVARRTRDAKKATAEQPKLDASLAAQDAQHGSDGADIAPQAVEVKDEAPVNHGEDDGRNPQVGMQVRITVRGREVDGEIVKLDATVARVAYQTTKGEPSVAVKALRDLRF